MKKIFFLASIMVASSAVSFAQQLNATPANDNVKQEDQRQKNRVPALNKATNATTVATPPAQLSHNGNTTLSKVNSQPPATRKAAGIPLHKQVSPTGHFVPQKVSPATK